MLAAKEHASAIIAAAQFFQAAAKRGELPLTEEEFETMRYDMQRERLEALATSGRMKPGLAMEDARRILWMYTGREVYRMLVEVGGWSADKYQTWLAAALMDALVGTPERR